MGAMTGNDDDPNPDSSVTQHHQPRTTTARSSHSYGSYETGESSAAGGLLYDPSLATTSKAQSPRTDPGELSPNSRSLDYGSRALNNELVQRRRRSHKPRPSGGFLLSSAVLDETPKANLASRDDGRRRSRIPVDNRKGKGHSNVSDNLDATDLGRTGIGIDSRDVVKANDGQYPGRLSPDPREERSVSRGGRPASRIPSPRPNSASLDVDSTQIVSMALNLSESRRLAARRNVSSPISSPIPPRLTPVTDTPAGGSLKQHLQQQRRTSRTISPKPDRSLIPRSVSNPRIRTPLQTSFDPESSYTYHFSSSTRNRAQKAKEHLELMAQYRRLLQFIPPLIQDARSRPSTSGSPTSPTSTKSSQNPSTSSTQLTLGRPYNPLQYIRNRKVRARERQTIDGETQGFADVSRVTDWIDETATVAATSALTPGTPSLPPFPGAHEAHEDHNQEYPPSSLPRPISVVGKPKRPRIDWSIDPADMLADTYWLEQGDNKNLIEDRHYSKIFPQKPEHLMLTSRQSNEPSKPTVPATSIKGGEGEITSNLELGKSKSTKMETETSPTRARDRARQKLQDLKGIHHKHEHGHPHIHHDILRFKKGSLSDTSDSESDRRRRERNGTISANGRDLLEKQMMEMLAKEASEDQTENLDDAQMGNLKQLPANAATLERSHQTSKQETGQSQKGSRVEILENQDKAHRGKITKASSIGSGRSSLEVPSSNYRQSMDLDSSRPGSPDSRPSRRRSTHVPTIGMDLSPPDSRAVSPSRNPFSRVKSIFRDRSRERVGDHAAQEKEDRLVSPVEQLEPLNLPTMTAARPRSLELPRPKSPAQKAIPKPAKASHKPHQSMGSIKLKGDEIGLRGIFKGGARIDDMIRGGVSKVTDLIWKKDAELEDISSSTSSSTDSEEDRKGRFRESLTLSRSSSRRPREGRRARNYLDVMPPFKSTSDSLNKAKSQETDILTPVHTTIPPERSSRFDQLKPPRIDIRRASPSSFELEHVKSRLVRESDVSDTESRSRDEVVKPRKMSKDLRNILPPAKQPPHRGSLIGPKDTRHWSISDRSPSPQQAQISKREVARLRTVILCSGIKAMEISRRSYEPHPVFALDTKAMVPPWTDISRFAAAPGGDNNNNNLAGLSVSQMELYPVTARVLSESIDRSIQTFEETAGKFVTETTPALHRRIHGLHGRVAADLIDMTHRAADEADEVNRDLVDSQRLKVKSVVDTMDKMLRRRRRRFRWVRRAGWLAVEWVLVGFMWYVWFVVMITRVFLGLGRGVVGVVKWLLFLS
ncbi:hypothetical protein F5B20DRAFT_258167 [Whalleya microplaca]|nr:hypothetical protein F5B20DRAFT_258167 [Whalleya microplaca]